MKLTSSRHRLALTAVFTAVVASSCSTSEPKEVKPTELKAASSRSVQAPQDVLLEEAKRYYLSGLYSLARENFLALAESYPTGPYTEFSILKAADALFEQGDFEEAAKEYEGFTKTYPSSTSMPYAMFRAGRSSQLSSGGVGRDATPLERAKNFYTEVGERFPKSTYAEAALRERTVVLKQLSAHESFISDFYYAQEAEVAADARASLANDLERQAAMSAKQNNSSKNSDSLRARAGGLDRPAIATVARVEDQAETLPQSDAKAFSTNQEILVTDTLRDNDFAAVDSRGTTIGKVECSDKSEKFVFIGTSSRITDTKFLTENRRVRAQNGMLSVTLPDVTARPRTMNCFGENDLVISSEGLITLNGVQEGMVFSVDSPPRIAIAILR